RNKSLGYVTVNQRCGIRSRRPQQCQDILVVDGVWIDMRHCLANQDRVLGDDSNVSYCRQASGLVESFDGATPGSVDGCVVLLEVVPELGRIYNPSRCN